ncbi:hypothetical protein [Streptomyces sp. NPDC088184]|uniref:hypothetical protein n=1 Tax=unclassified Streptomyces TaxID=2593676 RepID=UPI0034382170
MGTSLVYSPYLIHHRPDLDTDPETFDPDRWDPRRPHPPPAAPSSPSPEASAHSGSPAVAASDAEGQLSGCPVGQNPTGLR